MNPAQILQTLVNVENIHKASLVPLRTGQLVYGKVEKILSSDTAKIQIGNSRFIAQLKTSLSNDAHYWFEVTSGNDGKIQLKVVEGNGQNVQAELLLQKFQLPDTKINQRLLQFFITENIPFTKEQLQAATAWISSSVDAKELLVLEAMIKKDLPFTKQVFDSLVAVQSSELFSHQLEKAGKFLEDSRFASLPTSQALKESISTILRNAVVDPLYNSSEIKQLLQSMIHSLGLDYEKQLLTKNGENPIEALQSLKPLLMGAIKELGTQGKELEPLLNRITGLQILSQDVTGPMQNMVMQLPFTLAGKQTDVTIQWNGRKTKAGQIDPDYCRILFYLDLQSLKQTVIDMQIQNRNIHVSVMNETKELEPLITALTPTLKEKLENIGYTLSFIKVLSSSEKTKIDSKQPDFFSKEFIQRVDIKI